MKRFHVAVIAGLCFAAPPDWARADVVCVEEAGGVCLRYENRPAAPAPRLSPAQQAERDLGLNSAQRRAVQQRLADAGIYSGGIDGALGPVSRAAIRRWQRSEGEQETGYLTRQQFERLTAASLQPTGHPQAGRVYTESWNERLPIMHASDQDMEGRMTAELRRASADMAELTVKFESSNRPSGSFDGVCSVPLRGGASCRINGPLGAAVYISGSLPNLRIVNEEVGFW